MWYYKEALFICNTNRISKDSFPVGFLVFIVSAEHQNLKGSERREDIGKLEGWVRFWQTWDWWRNTCITCGDRQSVAVQMEDKNIKLVSTEEHTPLEIKGL